MGCPLPKYIKEERRRRPAKEEGRGQGSPTPTGSRIPSLSLIWTRRGRKEEERRRKGEGEEKERGGSPFSLVQFGPEGEGAQPALVAFPLFPLKPIKAHCFPVTTRYSEKYPNHSKPFRCPNIVVQYIDLYVSAISRLLVMSPISSRTPNYLRYIKTHKLIIPIVTKS